MAWGRNTGLDIFAISDVSAIINGADWSADILNSSKQLYLAKSAIDSSTKYKQLDGYGKKLGDKTDATTYKVGFNAAPCFTVSYKGYSVGLGFQYKDANSTYKVGKTFVGDLTYSTVEIVKYYKGTDFSLVAKTPEIAVTDEIKVQAGSSFYNNEIASVSIGTKSREWKTVFNKFETNRGSAIGGSVAVSYANDTMSAKVETDLGYTIKAYEVTGKEEATGIVEKKDTEKFCMDLVANFTMDPLSVDAYYKYYGTKKDAVDANYLSLQVATDLNTFDVPVKVELTGKDLLATTDHSVKAIVTAIENLELTVSDGYVLNTIGRDAKLMYLFNNLTEKPFAGQCSAKVGAKYTASFATISGEVSIKNWGLADAY